MKTFHLARASERMLRNGHKLGQLLERSDDFQTQGHGSPSLKLKEQIVSQGAAVDSSILVLSFVYRFSISCPLIRKRKEMPYHVPNPILHPFTTQINLVAPFSLKSQTGKIKMAVTDQHLLGS